MGAVHIEVSNRKIGEESDEVGVPVCRWGRSERMDEDCIPRVCIRRRRGISCLRCTERDIRRAWLDDEGWRTLKVSRPEGDGIL